MVTASYHPALHLCRVSINSMQGLGMRELLLSVRINIPEALFFIHRVYATIVRLFCTRFGLESGCDVLKKQWFLQVGY